MSKRKFIKYTVLTICGSHAIAITLIWAIEKITLYTYN